MFYILLNTRQENLERKQENKNTVESPGETTLILIHGYPTSSFDYHRAIDEYLIPLLRKSEGNPD